MASLTRSLKLSRRACVCVCGLLALACLIAAPVGCEDNSRVSANVTRVKIAGKSFFLEIAATPEVRFKGMGGRDHIEDDGGMIFVFSPAEVQVMSFVMRDCPIDIDIAYLDGAGRVLTMHTMKPEPPRSDEEKVLEPDPTRPAWAHQNAKYEERLKGYSSRYPCQFVLELKAGTLQKLGVKEGDLVEIDAPALKKLAK